MNNFEKSYEPKNITDFTKKVKEVAEKTKIDYPVFINTSGATAIPSIYKMNLKEVCKTFEMEEGSADSPDKVYTKFVGTLGEYEFVNIYGEKKKIKLPILPDMKPEQIYQFAADFLEYANSLRTFVNIYTMTNANVIALDSKDTGIIFADKLLNPTGTSVEIEQAIRSVYGSMDVNVSKVNEYIRIHEEQRVLISLTDKFITGQLNILVKGCRGFAKRLKENVAITPVRIDSTNVTPVMTKEGKDSVKIVSAAAQAGNNIFPSLFGTNL